MSKWPYAVLISQQTGLQPCLGGIADHSLGMIPALSRCKALLRRYPSTLFPESAGVMPVLLHEHCCWRAGGRLTQQQLFQLLLLITMSYSRFYHNEKMSYTEIFAVLFCCDTIVPLQHLPRALSSIQFAAGGNT
jgi:hypothetical protein